MDAKILRLDLVSSNGGVIQLEQQQVAGLAPGEDIDGQEAYEEGACRLPGVRTTARR